MFAIAAPEKETHTTEVAVDHYDTGHHDVGFFEDTATWVLIPFLIVVGIFIWKGVPKMVTNALDERGTKIADNIEAARAMREEAQELLATYQRRQREAEDEAAGIIEQAKRDSKRLAAEAREKLDEQLARQTKAAEEKIARAEAQAIAEVRNQTAEISAAAAENIIRSRVDAQAQVSLVDKAIADVRSKLN